jgi:RNA polymerase sigma-70 factor, ECF subfamily
VALALDTNANAVKGLLHRGRVALAEARGRADGDVPADPEVVERFARAVHEGSIEAITGMLAEDVWGVADGGGLVVTANKPTFGREVVSRQWENARRKLPVPVSASIVRCNGEESVLVRLREAPEVVVALVHLETRDGTVVAQRVLRDPVRLQRLGVTARGAGWLTS